MKRSLERQLSMMSIGLTAGFEKCRGGAVSRVHFLPSCELKSDGVEG